MAPGCKPGGVSLRRFESFPVHHFFNRPAGVAQLARASAFQAEGRGFEPRFPLQRYLRQVYITAQVAQQVEHLLGKEEVIGSSPILSSTFFYITK